MLLTVIGLEACAPALASREDVSPIVTDRTAYTLTDNPLGFSEFLIQATFRNETDSPVELRLCQYTPPLFWLEKRTIHGWERVYDPLCYALGRESPELVLPSGSTRDTLHIRHHPGAIPRFRVEEVSGDYRVAYPLILWSPAGVTRRTVVYSNVFQVHLPRQR